jgi:hypothetical protein
MSSTSNESDSVNMVPLIDCMFFLIVFFLLVVRFTPDEKSIASLLPTDKGQPAPPTDIPLLEQINLAIYPAGFERAHQPSEYEQQLAGVSISHLDAWLRIGGSDVLEVSDRMLARTSNDIALNDQLNAVGTYVQRELAQRELPGKPRHEQAPIVISGYSELPWKYMLLAYDAVRNYEARVTGKRVDQLDFAEARNISFAPAPIRSHTRFVRGSELYQLIHLR